MPAFGTGRHTIYFTAPHPRDGKFIVINSGDGQSHARKAGSFDCRKAADAEAKKLNLANNTEMERKAPADMLNLLKQIP